MAYFVFSDGRDTFVVQILDPAQIAHARGLIDGSIVDEAHVGGIVTAAPADYNVGWAYHVAPDDVQFYDLSAEIGDAPIRDVEEFVQSGRPLEQFLPENSWGSWATFMVRELREVAGTAAVDTLTGSGTADIIFGHGANDSLSGAAGNDFLIGGDGDDTLDGGTGHDKLGGGDGADTLYGGSGKDVLDGGSSADAMYGGDGNDTIIVDSDLDLTIEYADGGTDLVKSSLSHRLASNIEQLKLIGWEHINGIGNSDDNVLWGNSGNNKLWGLDGNDVLYGDAGDDRIASGNDQLYGGGGDDRLHGGAGNDRLVGGAGADVMRGGSDDDAYYVDDFNDRVVENFDDGVDTVYSAISFSLTSNVENLALTGSAVRGDGNSLANTITGNAANNILNGGLGVDTMSGGAGDDRYFVDNAGDDVLENSSAGTDRVYSSVSLSLDSNLEQLFLRGSAAINATGNSLDNTLVGNSAANVLRGAGGADDLRGGGGADVFEFRDGDFAGLSPSTADRIIDFSRAQHDRIDLDLVDADTSLDGLQDFDFIGSGAFTGTAGELRYQQVNGNTYVTGDTDGDGIADFMIRLDGLHTLTEGDFII